MLTKTVTFFVSGIKIDSTVEIVNSYRNFGFNSDSRISPTLSRFGAWKEITIMILIFCAGENDPAINSSYRRFPFLCDMPTISKAWMRLFSGAEYLDPSP
jgi:hypothetical protein